MPTCMAALQNQAKNITLQNPMVDSDDPSCATRMDSLQTFSSPDMSDTPSCLRATRPQARNTNTIQGEAMLANLATVS